MAAKTRRGKLKEFQEWMRRERVGMVLFFNGDFDRVDANYLYFTGYSGFGALGITQKKAALVVPMHERTKAQKQSRVRVVAAKKRLLPVIKTTLKVRPRKVGIDKNKVTLNFYNKLRQDLNARYVDVSGTCLELRATKTEEELKILRKACRITDDIFHKLFLNFKKFDTEAQVSDFLRRDAERRADGVAFSPVVASGGNGCSPHHKPDKNKLKRGFCVIDYGVKLDGYCSDETRTVFIGSPNVKEVEMYYDVLKVQQDMIKKCVVGADFTKIDEAAHKAFGKREAHFTHLVGHGLGLDVHENPNPKKTIRRPITTLLEGSVITIEPGLYYEKKSGIRIEDDILVTKNGPKLLTKTGKNLLVIKKK